MYVITTADPVAAIRAQARRERVSSMPARVCRFLVDAWLRHLEKRIAYAVARLDHKGVQADFWRASRG